MGRSFSLLGMMVFSIGVLALASLTRRTALQFAPVTARNPGPVLEPARVIPVHALAYHAPVSAN
jgi:hypothetical protein